MIPFNKTNLIGTRFCLTLNDSLMLKGLAICFMLWHHLFYQHIEYGLFVNQTAIISKVVVALFLFISGYGLTIQYNTIQYNTIKKAFRFILKRFVKFYFNYWFVFVVFVPIGVFVFGRELATVYGEENKTYLWLLIDYFGFADHKSYNITWWFNRLIICLYVIFPLIFYISKKWSILSLILVFVLQYIRIPFIGNWIFPFSIGILTALNLDFINNILNKFKFSTLLVLSIIVILCLSIVRQKHIIPLFNGVLVDGFLAFAIVIFSVLLFPKFKTIYSVLITFGKHSMNMYLIHTFIFYYFFNEFIYSFKYPLLIFIVLLITSLITSIILEFVKNKIGFFSIIKKINLYLK